MGNFQLKKYTKGFILSCVSFIGEMQGRQYTSKADGSNLNSLFPARLEVNLYFKKYLSGAEP